MAERVNLLKRLDRLRGGGTLYIEDLSEVEAEIYGTVQVSSRTGKEGEHARTERTTSENNT